MKKKIASVDKSVFLVEEIVRKAMTIAKEVRDALGTSGKEVAGRNQYGDEALRLDVEIEKAILACLQRRSFPIKLISEELGDLSVTDSLQFIGILDGLDGFSQYQSESMGRYGTMFALYQGNRPSYGDYFAVAIMEYPTGRLIIARKGGGCFEANGGEKKPIITSRRKMFSEDTKVYTDMEFDRVFGVNIVTQLS